ncbi:hypothetical protein FHU37_000850 [Allostreptomyces psammosilenae]|uniref:Uncharacterized protein n=1 Tax=Allostreptomyces psammosilenae TaxID=1892865 RepID=A0A852ZQY6_9ACTN|nr:hypothetical protein [Allostreptomyces psammosilenae]
MYLRSSGAAVAGTIDGGVVRMVVVDEGVTAP